MHYTYNIEYLFSKNPFSPEIEKKRIEERGRGAEEEEGESGGRGNRAPLLILEHSIVFVSARVQNTHFHRGWRNVIWNDGACDLRICNLSYASPGLSTLGIVIRYWPFLLPPSSPFFPHAAILIYLTRLIKVVTRFARTGDSIMPTHLPKLIIYRAFIR